jgi:hypothetical protein
MQMRPPRTIGTPGFLYFIGPESDEHPIKIGWTADPSPRRRLATLQTGCWLPLKCYGMIPIAYEEERGYHAELAAWRVHKEWFERVAALLLLAQLQEYHQAADEWEQIVAEDGVYVP